jgi:starch phosphorylase
MDKKKKNMKEQLKESFKRHLTRTLAKRFDKASDQDRYQALALSIRDLMVEKWIETKDTFDEIQHKCVYYLSLEFLMGRALGNAMINLEVFEVAKEAMSELGFDLEEIREQEADAGLGNGGLGRLAACFMDSMATLDLPARGYGIHYDYGIFEQKIEDGFQVEEPDNWLRNGNPWEIRRPELARVIHFNGHTETCPSFKKNKCRKRWVDTEDVLAMPYDTPIPGYKTNNVNTLRLWSSESLYGFNLNSFNEGDYINANLEASMTQNITKVLYPNDNNFEGKELRLKQQYLLVSASMQDIIGKLKYMGYDIRKFDEMCAIQLNDTHPALAVPELMRLLIDEEDLTWDEAWAICTKTFSYTNHTLMSEALERWPVSMLEKLLPRILEIIYEINARFLREIANMYPGDLNRLSRMSLIEEGQEKMARMSYMAVLVSKRVNGVAALHTELLKNGLFKDFYEYAPEKFINVTNGITPRRWLRKANPALSQLISDNIGDDWIKHLDKLKDVEKFSGNKTFRKKFREIKRENKVYLSNYIMSNLDVKVDPDSIFDVQVKRLHEYKRQLLNILNVVAMYLDIKDSPKADFVPRTVMFGAKAAPGYYMAKMIIKLINSVGEVINQDRTIKNKLKVLFLPNYRVSLAEKIIPAADLSEQISLAGTEASGTGNMKFALNGALTIGTMDGANVEIHDAVGEENIFIFGMKVNEVKKLRAEGYNPEEFLEQAPKLKRALDLISMGYFSQENPGIFDPVMDNMKRDFYMIAADFNSYYDTQQEVASEFQNKDGWDKKAIINVANMGHFSSDRSIQEYANNIWSLKPISVP